MYVFPDFNFIVKYLEFYWMKILNFKLIDSSIEQWFNVWIYPEIRKSKKNEV